MSQTYRLRICTSDETGQRAIPTVDTAIPADDDADAIEEVRSYPVEFFLEAGDTAWLIDGAGREIWSLQLHEA